MRVCVCGWKNDVIVVGVFINNFFSVFVFFCLGIFGFKLVLNDGIFGSLFYFLNLVEVMFEFKLEGDGKLL